MKSFIFTLAFSLLALTSVAQQILIGPVGVGVSLTVTSAKPLPGGDIIAIGRTGGDSASAVVCRYNSTGVVWMKRTNEVNFSPGPQFGTDWSFSQFHSVVITSSGNIVAVGVRDSTVSVYKEEGLVVCFDQTGNLLWSRVISFPDKSVFLRDVVEDTASGDLIAVGSLKQIGSSDAVELITKVDSDGAVLWVTALNQYGNQSGHKVLIKGDNVLVFGEFRSFDGTWSDITLSVYRKSDGLKLSHWTYDSANKEDFLDAVLVGSRLYFSFKPEGVGYTMITSLSSNYSVGRVVYLYSNTASLSGCVLSTNGTAIFASGKITDPAFGGSAQGSYAASINQALTTVNWAKRISLADVSGAITQVSSFSSNGRVAFVGTKNVGVGGLVSTSLSYSGVPYGTYCDEPGVLNFQLPEIFMSYNSSILGQSFPIPDLGSASFSDIPTVFTNCTIIILPLELVSFTGEKDEETTLLSWQTATEVNVSHFVILRSTDEDSEWKEIGSVGAVGNSQHLISYDFVDDSPAQGNNYYRLKSVDLDGTFTLSHLVAVHFDLKTPLTVYPNPATAGEALNVKGEFFEAIAHDQLGREVKLQRNGNQLAVQAGPGVYLLTFTDASGVSETVRVVIN
jgi:hypothetical protein